MKKCPDCNKQLKAEAFQEGTQYSCECGYYEFWHRYGSSSDPQIWRKSK